MDPTLRKTIQDVKDKCKNSEPTIDWVQLETCCRELKTKLYIKRDEVNLLRTELDAANVEMQGLRKALDATKKALDDNQLNLNLHLRKTRNNEEELQEKRESLMKIQLQHKMTIAEVDTLKENLQKSEMERLELSRKVDMLETKQRYNSAYHQEILKRDNHLRNCMESVNKIAIELRAEHSEAIQLSKKIHLANETTDKLKICVHEIEKLRKQKEQFEEMYVKVNGNAKYEKLEELMAADPIIKTPNLITQIIFSQWKQARLHYETEMKHKNEILNKMTESLSKEKQSNIKLIKENENMKYMIKGLEEEIEKLKELYTKTDELPPTNENRNLLDLEEMKLKEEPIEIDD